MNVRVILLTTALALAAPAAKAAAQSAAGGGLFEPSGVGLGLELGLPSGFTAQGWLDRTDALEAGAGFGPDFEIHADYLRYGWKAFPQPPQGRVAAFFGGGLQEDAPSNRGVGARLIVGASYFPADIPLEAFIETGPRIGLSYGGVYLDLSVGFRYYFKAFN